MGIVQNLAYVYSCGIARSIIIYCNVELDVVSYIDISGDIHCLGYAHIHISYCSDVSDFSMVVFIVGFVFITVYMNRICEVS